MKKHPVLREIQRGSQYLLDTVFPPHCVSCERNGTVLCSSCIAQFKPMPLLSCPTCINMTLEVGMVCKKCRYKPPGLSGLFAVCMYEEPLRSCIHALKYDGNLRLAEPLGTLLGQSFSRYALQADAIVPVPLHRDRQHQRGYNQAQLLAEICATLVDVPFHEHMLVRHRATLPQVGLSAKDRSVNIAGAFLCTPAYATGALFERSIVIIDDITTTGATLRECAAPLYAAGAKEVKGLVLAQLI
ncbi:MAG TPA: ComF family protein [Ktedonobacteraceae bacterium]|nr:ComF family protein [Ktedonobacteraceae bacterium]